MNQESKYKIIHQAEELLERYYRGETTLGEEAQLRRLFAETDENLWPEELRADRVMFLELTDEATGQNPGINEEMRLRFDKTVDQLAGGNRRSRRGVILQWAYAVAGCAAAIILAIGVIRLDFRVDLQPQEQPTLLTDIAVCHPTDNDTETPENQESTAEPSTEKTTRHLNADRRPTVVKTYARGRKRSNSRPTEATEETTEETVTLTPEEERQLEKMLAILDKAVKTGEPTMARVAAEIDRTIYRTDKAIAEPFEDIIN